MQTSALDVLRLVALATKVDGCTVHVLALRGSACVVQVGPWVRVFDCPRQAADWLLGTLQRR